MSPLALEEVDGTPAFHIGPASRPPRGPYCRACPLRQHLGAAANCSSALESVEGSLDLACRRVGMKAVDVGNSSVKTPDGRPERVFLLAELTGRTVRVASHEVRDAVGEVHVFKTTTERSARRKEVAVVVAEDDLETALYKYDAGAILLRRCRKHLAQGAAGGPSEFTKHSFVP